jgi:16S rRNA (guanine966-N2)-methyltransferase
MRIIAGRFRSRVLLPPEGGDTTRPITDRVKQSLFDMIAPHIEGAAVYDVFAGTGSMGLESLSRGAAHATFFEADRSALERLRKNIATLNVGAESTVVPGDLFKYFRRTAPPAACGAGLIFLDPPYRFLREQPDRLQALAADLAAHLTADGLVVFRHDSRDQLALPLLTVKEIRIYGNMSVGLLGKPADVQGEAG